MWTLTLITGLNFRIKFQKGQAYGHNDDADYPLKAFKTNLLKCLRIFHKTVFFSIFPVTPQNLKDNHGKVWILSEHQLPVGGMLLGGGGGLRKTFEKTGRLRWADQGTCRGRHHSSGVFEKPKH